jgi:hypothetical protein
MDEPPHTHQRHDDPMLAAILNAVTALGQKVDANHKESTTTLKHHMEDEEGKIEAMTESFGQWKDETSRRLDSVIQSMNSYSECMNGMVAEIHTAFLKTPAGTPDFKGHHEDHDYRKTIADALREMVKDTFKKIFSVVLLAVMTAALYGVWDTFLRGPQP